MPIFKTTAAGGGSSGGGDVEVKEDGASLTTAVTTLDFKDAQLEEPSADSITIYQELPFIADGRLTLTTATPVTTTDVTAAGTLYYALYHGNKVSLYDGTRWKKYTFTERSLSLSVTSGKNYDVFLYDNAGTLTLELSAAWTNDTTRADALARQDGVWCKSGALTRRWLGIIRASGSNTCEDSERKRFVFNYYNRVQRTLFANPGYSNGDSTSSFTMDSTSMAQINGGTDDFVEYLADGETLQEWEYQMYHADSGGAGIWIGVGHDSTTGVGKIGARYIGGVDTINMVDKTYASAGYHVARMLAREGIAGALTIYADESRQGSSADPRATYLYGSFLG